MIATTIAIAIATIATTQRIARISTNRNPARLQFLAIDCNCQLQLSIAIVFAIAENTQNYAYLCSSHLSLQRKSGLILLMIDNSALRLETDVQ